VPTMLRFWGSVDDPLRAIGLFSILRLPEKGTYAQYVRVRDFFFYFSLVCLYDARWIILAKS